MPGLVPVFAVVLVLAVVPVLAVAGRVLLLVAVDFTTNGGLLVPGSCVSEAVRPGVAFGAGDVLVVVLLFAGVVVLASSPPRPPPPRRLFVPRLRLRRHYRRLLRG